MIRRGMLGAVFIWLVAVFAACTVTVAPTGATPTVGNEPPATPTQQPPGGIANPQLPQGNLLLLISDENNAIDDFAHLWVEIDKVGIRDRSESGGWIEFSVPDDAQTVDLTQLTGEAATALLQANAPPGEYGKIFIHVDSVQGELKTGETVDVKLPSSKLQINTPFAVSEDAVTSFVFDLTVVAAGNPKNRVKYLLKPQIGESGPNKAYKLKEGAGKERGRDTLTVTIMPPTADATTVTVSIADASGAPVANAQVTLEVELQPLVTSAAGIVTLVLPDGTKKLRAESEVEESEGELRLSFPSDSDENDEDAKGLKFEVIGDAAPGSPLTLLLTDDSGTPVEGAGVEIKLTIDAGATNAGGSIETPLLEGTIEVEATAKTANARGRGKLELDELGDYS